jgi:hypothetical protein
VISFSPIPGPLFDDVQTIGPLFRAAKNDCLRGSGLQLATQCEGHFAEHFEQMA